VFVQAMRPAVVVSAGKITCPHCGSDDTAYNEDITNEHRLLEVRPGVLVFSASCHTEESAFNERICCKECGEEALFPAGWELAFE
jgi:hypothetical protein